MNKNILTALIAILTLTILTGCLKRDKMEDINVATTIYPIEYVTNRIYKDHSQIKSIYPRNSIAKEYKISKKQIKDYSEYDLFIYNGESNEREYATKMLNENKKLKIIDAAYGLEATYQDSDIWLNPSNVLMIGQNIKNDLTEYIEDPYLKDEIIENYNQLKVDITELETELKKAADNSINSNIIVADESLNFLEKYGFTIINLTEKGKNKENNIEKAKQLLNKKEVDYLFVIEHQKELEIIDTITNTYKIEKLTFRKLDTITEEDEKNNDDYISIMHSNIDLLKQETYK